MLRICFTAADFRRVRVAGRSHPSWETVLSINDLQSPGLPARHWAWRDSVIATARQHGHHKWLAAASAVVPADGNFPDFLTPAVADPDIEAHYDAILSTPRDVVRNDLARTFRRTATPPRWAQPLYRDGRTNGLVTVLRNYHRLAMEPIWPQVHRHIEFERARCARHLLHGGVDELLESLHPSIRWDPPVLRADYPVDLNVKLGGRGITLVPAHFCWGGPVTYIHTETEPMLIFPASGEAVLRTSEVSERPMNRLAALIGHTRAQLLAHLTTIPATTSQLATLLSVTPAAISQHTKILREAGLVSTTRNGTSVQHALTPRGQRLLDD